MGCTPSTSGATYCQERACVRDLDTCSTVVASAKSSLSTPERPAASACVEGEGGKQTFLREPSRSWRGRAPDACNELSAPASPSSSPAPDPAIPASPACTPRAGPGAWSSESETPPRDQRSSRVRLRESSEMKSEKEVVSTARDRRLVEIQFRDLPREQDGVSANPKHKEEKKEVFTKVVIRRLPPSLTKDQLEEHLSPLPAYDYFEFFSADQSLYPHLFSRAYINFKNPDDIVLFRDRFDGYVFIDNKGQEYPAVVEFAPFQKVSKKKVKKKDAKAGSIEEDPEYRRFLENCCDEEKTTANPETLLGEIEAKTRELIAKKTTPLLEYIKNKKLEKQRIREEKREERRRRELEKKRQREEEKRKRREEERRKRKEAEKQKKLAEKEIKIKLLKKSDRDDDPDPDRLKDKGDSGDPEKSKWEKGPGHVKSKHLDKDLKDKSLAESDKEQREHGRRPKDPERHRGRDEERKRQRHHYEFEKLARRKDETKWGKGYCQDRARREGQHHGYTCGSESGDKAGKDERDDLSGRKERIRNKDRPAMQLYTPGARSRTRMSSAGNGYDCCSNSPERGGERRYEVTAGTGSEKSGDE